jgi:hypothetical protein
LAVYALGASPELIRDVYYKIHLPKLLPPVVSPGPITEENFIEHLSDAKYYDAYLAFFTDYLQSHSPTEALERFVFSPAYNFRSDLTATDRRDSKEKVRQPQMLNRLLAGVVHPFIYLAYGLEFGILGHIAQGLAQAAVHDADPAVHIPPSYFTNSRTNTTNDADLSNRIHRLEIASSAPEKRPTFAFHRRIRDDPAFTVELPSSISHQYPAVAKGAGGAIHDLVQEWTEEWLGGVGTRGGAGAEARLRGMVEEVIWGNVIWYGIGGWASRGETGGRVLNADFFIAHLVTSAIFLPKLVLNEDGSSSVSGLSFASRLLLLQTYLAVAAAWYIMRGNDHALPIGDFYAATDTQLFAPSRAGSANTGWTQAPGSAWPRVFQSAVRFQDEHMPKIARALGNFAVRWGTRAPGYFAVTGEEEKARMGAGLAPALEGIERLDGTLFVRVAGLTFDRLGWVDEGETAGRWDLDGIPMMGVHGEDKCTAQLLADLV